MIVMSYILVFLYDMWQEIEVDKKFSDEDNNIIENKLGYYKEGLLRDIRKFKNNEIELDKNLDGLKKKKNMVIHLSLKTLKKI